MEWTTNIDRVLHPNGRPRKPQSIFQAVRREYLSAVSFTVGGSVALPCAFLNEWKIIAGKVEAMFCFDDGKVVCLKPTEACTSVRPASAEHPCGWKQILLWIPNSGTCGILCSNFCFKSIR